MAFDEILASRVREVLFPRNDVTERKMFGGICFMVAGHMCCCVGARSLREGALMLRVGPENYEDALRRRHVKPMTFTGRPLTGFIYVKVEGLKTKRDLARWVGMGVGFVESLPAKKPKKEKPKKEKEAKAGNPFL